MLDRVGGEFGLQERAEIVGVRHGIVCGFARIAAFVGNDLALVEFSGVIDVFHAVVVVHGATFLRRDRRGTADRLSSGFRQAALRFRHGRIAYCGSKYFSASTGFACPRTSQSNITPTESPLPTS